MQTTTGATPLYIASSKGHVGVVTALLAASADVDAAKVCTDMCMCVVQRVQLRFRIVLVRSTGGDSMQQGCVYAFLVIFC